MQFLTWLAQTDLGVWARESQYGYYLLLEIHAIGMVLVVGIVMMLNVRVLGYAQGVPVPVFRQLVSLGWWGFAVNAITGAILFTASGDRLILNPEFLVKIFLIALGGVMVWVLSRVLRREGEPAIFGPITLDGRLIALASITIWIGAIVAGRLIAYTLPDPAPPSISLLN